MYKRLLFCAEIRTLKRLSSFFICGAYIYEVR